MHLEDVDPSEPGKKEILTLREVSQKEYKLSKRILKLQDEFTSSHIKAGNIILKAFRNMI